jgi:hypothetical protein
MTASDINDDPFAACKKELLSKVFTANWSNKLCAEFGLKFTASQKQKLREVASCVGTIYEPLKSANTGKATYTKSRQLLKRASGHLGKAKDSLMKAFKNNQMECFERLHAANKKSARVFYRETIEENNIHSETTDFIQMLRFIEALKVICGEASSKNLDPDYRMPSVAIETSLRNLLPFWREHIETIIPYTTGEHYGGKTKYNSSAVDLVWRIYLQIDSVITREQISTAIIATRSDYAR